MPYTTEEKLKEIDRELMQRHRVYRRLIANGKMRNDVAARQIAILTDIANDYRSKAKEGPLFDYQPTVVDGEISTRYDARNPILKI